MFFYFYNLSITANLKLYLVGLLCLVNLYFFIKNKQFYIFSKRLFNMLNIIAKRC